MNDNDNQQTKEGGTNMKRMNLGRRTIAGALLCLIAAAGAGRAETDIMDGKLAVSADSDLGIQFKAVGGSNEKFNEYRDIQRGFLIDDFRFHAEDAAGPYHMAARIQNPLRDNESYSLDIGRHGLYDLKFLYDSTPHNFSTAKLLFNGVGTGDLLIPNQIQTSLQAQEQTELLRSPGAGRSNPLIDTNGSDMVTKGIVDDLYATRDFTTLRIKRENTKLSLDFDVAQDVKTWVKVGHEKRDGARSISAGSYERFNQGANGLTHLKDLFLISGADLAEPVDFRTISFTAGLGVYKKTWQADAEYAFVDFDNQYSALHWDNAMRITDATSLSDAVAPVAANNYDRGRFVRGQLTLPPDSRSHQVNVNGAVDLPLRSRFVASLGYGIINQDAPFNPYSLNSAISAAAGLDVTNPASLPVSSLDGAVTTLTQSYVLTSRPVDPLTTTLKYRFYKYKNDSRRVTLPGYAAWGESWWRTVKNDFNAPVQNDTLGFTKHTVDFSADYRVVKPLALGFETGYEYFDRDELMIDKSKEFSVGGNFTWKPAAMASLKAGYKFAKRTVTGYADGMTAKNPEALGKTNFDWAERTRNKADGRLQLTPADSVSIGVSGQFMHDQYSKDTRFGLKDVIASGGAVDVSYSPSDAATVYASYSRDHRKSKMLSGAKDDAFNAVGPLDDSFLTDNYNPYNYWNSNITETVDTVGVGAVVQLVPEKLDLDASYNFSHTRTDTYTYNPNGLVKLMNAEAQDWPLVKNTLHEVKADLGYRFTKSLKAGARYMYEGFHLTDFAWDAMKPYMATLTAENSTRYLFADATYRNYDAHVGMLYLSCSF